MRLRVRFPIRNKLLLLMGTLVTFSIVTYLALAIKLFRDDKTTLIYELNSSSARTVASEFRSEIQNLVSRVNLLAQGYRNSDWVNVLLRSERDLLSFSLYRKGADGRWIRMSYIDNSTEFRRAKDDPAADFSHLHSTTEAVQAIERTQEDEFWLGIVNREKYPQVGSLMRKVTFEGESTPAIAVADFTLERFIDLANRSTLAALTIVSPSGEVLVTADPGLQARGRFTDTTLVESALRSPVSLQMSEFTFEGERVLSAFADVGIGGLKVVSWVPAEQVFRASARLINKSVLFGLFLITLGLFFSVRVARGLTEPLSRLVEATSAVQEWRFNETLAVKTQDEVGALAGAFNTMATNLREQRERMGEMQLQLVLSERLAAVGQVARGVGHEFGNILMRVMGKMDLAMADTEDLKVKEHLNVAIQALERGAAILQNMRSFSKRDSQFGPVDLGHVIEQARSLMNHEMRMKSVQWKESLQFQGQLEADAVQLGQVFLNLFINAVHAMPEGGVLEVSTVDRGEQVEVVVSDSGTGIPEEVLSRIFEASFSTKGEHGSGLGLSVSKEILDQHQAEVRVESKVGQGTRFTILLPKRIKPVERELQG